MRSELVVISWWSNCLGLTCLYNLVERTDGRTIYVVQVGKSAAQQARFRERLPTPVRELPYPADAPAEHGKVLERIVRDLLPEHEGVWFLDHDWFVLEPFEPWLLNMDRTLAPSDCCLCHSHAAAGPALTCPAFWLSPARLPDGLPGFEPVPYQPSEVWRRPDRFRAPADLRMPDKDTLALAQEFLAARGLVREYALASLPRYRHLAGLYLFAYEILPDLFRDWMAECVARFTAFFAACPADWLGAEDPVLLERLAEFREAVL
jgi:hypothetical protein